MTAPINFPSISAPQLVDSRSQLEGLGEFMLALQQGRQQIAQARERLALERQRTEDQLKNSEENRSASAEDRKRAKDKFDQEQRVLDAADLVHGKLAELRATGQWAPEHINKAFVGLVQSNKKLADEIGSVFWPSVGKQEQAVTEIAQRRSAEVAANVAEQTERTTVEGARTALANARVALNINQIQQGLLTLQQQRDPSRVAVAENLFARGIPWGQAREAAGLAPGGIPDDAVLPGAGTGGAQATAMAPIASMFKLGKTMVDAAGNSGLTDLSAFRLTTRIQTLDLALNKLTSPEQRQQVQGFRLMGTAFGRYISGQQSTDREALRLMNILAVLKSDDTETRAQKRAVVDIIGNVIDAAAQGTMSPVAAMDMIIGAARERGMSGRALELMRQQRADAARFETRQTRPGATRAPADAARRPGDTAPAGMGDAIDAMLGAGGFIVRPTPPAR